MYGGFLLQFGVDWPLKYELVRVENAETEHIQLMGTRAFTYVSCIPYVKMLFMLF